MCHHCVIENVKQRMLNRRDLFKAVPAVAVVEFAEDELRFMREMCDDHDPNTLLVVAREMVEAGISESFRSIKPQEATLDMVAIHGELDDI